MSPEDLKNLRAELDCTAKELATALDVEQETILAWERGELFPTKRFVTKMEALRRAGKGAIVRKPRKAAAATSPNSFPDRRRSLDHGFSARCRCRGASAVG